MEIALLKFRARIPTSLYVGIACSSMLLLLLSWFVVTHFEWLPIRYFPNPVQVFETGYDMFAEEGFHLDLLASTGRIFVAFLISAIIAIPLGLLMSSFKVIEAVFEPAVDFIRYVPVPALLPLFVLWGGIGEFSKFLVLFFGTFFQLVLLVMDDADNVSQVYFDQAKTLGATERELFQFVLIPYLLPQLFDRMRITLGWCWTYLIIAELIAVERGVGHVIKEAQRYNAAEQIYWSCLILGLIGLGTDYLAKVAYKRFFPYAIKSADSRS